MTEPDYNASVAQVLQTQTAQQAAQLKQSLAVGLDYDPDAYAKSLKLAMKTGIPPQIAEQNRPMLEKQSTLDGIDFDSLVRSHSRTAQWLSTPDNAAVAHDDLPSLLEIEKASQGRPQGSTDSQWQAIKDERLRVLAHNKPRNEAMSLASTAGMGFSGPILSTADTLSAIPSLAAETVGSVADFLTGPQTLDATARRIWEAIKDPLHPGTTGGDIQEGTNTLRRGWTAPVKIGPSQYLTDPTTQQVFENPDYHWYGRDTVQTVASIPGAAAFFAMTGKAGMHATVANAGREKYQAAIQQGADPLTALAEGLGSAGVNYTLMNKVPHAAQADTALGQILESTKRGVTLGTGVTAAENALSRLHGSDVPLWSGLPQGIVSMTGFELAPTLPRLIEAASTSRLKARSPEAFQDAAEGILKGTPAEEVMIPADRFLTFFQEAGADPAKVAEQLGAKNFTEALAAGTDLILPTSEALATLPAEQLKELLPDMRLKSEPMTPRQRAAYVQEAPERVAQLVAQAKAELPDDQLQAFTRIKDEIHQRLVESGRLSPALAEDNAALLARGLVNQGAREGLDPLKIFEGYGLKITGPETGEQEGTTLQQPGDHRGSITFGDDNKVSIALLEKADPSTFIHELGHFWLKMQTDLAARPEASEQTKEDMATILRWMGVEAPDQISSDHHEQFARAHEAYLREGQAPTPELRGTFVRFKTWLTAIYRKLTDLKVNLTPEVRNLFDRIYASDEELRTAKLHGDRPLFESPERAGMTPEQFAAYRKLGGLERGAGRAIVEDQMREQADRSKLQWWKDELGAVREEVAPIVDANQDQRAFRVLGDGRLEDGTPIKLNKAALVEQFGADALKDLPHKGARWVYAKEGGMDAETAAEILGYQSGKDLLDALKTMPSREELIQSEAERVMRERHGDMLTDGSLAEAAVRAIHNEPRESRLMMELQALRKKQEAAQQGRAEARSTLKEIPHIQVFRDAAQEIVEGMPISSLDPWRYIQASRKAAREAFDAMAKDKFSEAGDAKQRELLNHFLYLEAVKGREEAASIRNYALKFDRASVRERMAKAGGKEGQHLYLDQIDNLLEQGQFTNISNKAIRERQSLQEFALQQAAKEKAEREAIYGPDQPGITPPSSLDPSLLTVQPKNYRESTLPELRAVRDAIKNIETMASRALGYLQDGKQVDFEAESLRFDHVARKNNGTTPVPRTGTELTVKEKASRWVRGLDSYLLKFEWLVDKLDGGDINGPARENIKRPIDEATGRRTAMATEVYGKLKPLFDAMPEKDRRDMFESTGVTFPKMDRPLSRMQLVSWLLNLGSSENRNVALYGEGLVQEDGSLHPAFAQALRAVRKSEAAFVQGVWDVLGSMAPAIREKALRTTGIEPKWKQASPFTIHTADGATVEMRGGYYPLKGDPIDSVGRRQQDPAQRINVGYSRPKTSTSHLQEVSGATYRLMLDYQNVLGQHLSDVITDTTMGEALSQVFKFIHDPENMTTLQETLGPKEAHEFLPWLQDVATSRQGSPNDAGPVLRFLMTRRSGMAAAQVGGSFMSYMVHAGTDWMKIIADPDFKIEPGKLAQAFLDIRRNPEDLIKSIREMSPNEMAYREQNAIREIRELMDERGTFEEKKKVWAEFVMQGFQVIDHTVTFPVWLARYRQGLAEHGDSDQAAREADRVIARSFQSGENRNMSRIMREPGYMKLMTTFMGPANTWYGLISSSLRSGNVKRVSAALMAVMAEQIVAEAIRGRLPQEDENKGAWLTEQALLAGIGKIPFFGDWLKYGIDKMTGRHNTGLQNSTMHSLEKTAGAPFAVKGWLAGDVEGTKAAQDVVEAAGMWAGVPGTAQVVRDWRYIHNVQTGKDSADTPGQVVRGLITGRGEKK